jgi:hypothetical protein
MLGLSFLVAFSIRDIGLVKSRSAVELPNNNLEAKEK